MRLQILVCLFLAVAPALAVGPTEPKLQGEPEYRDVERLIKTERYAEAIAALLRLDKQFPNEPEVLNWLGFAHRKLKDYPTSKRFYDAALAVDPVYRPALEYQGMWFIETGDIPAAKANLDKLRRICGRCEEMMDLEDALAKAGH